MPFAQCNLYNAICTMQFEGCNLQVEICKMQFERCNLQDVICKMQFAICKIKFIRCNLQCCIIAVCVSCHTSGSLEGGRPSSVEVIEDTEDFVYYSRFYSLFSVPTDLYYRIDEFLNSSFQRFLNKRFERFL